MLNKVRQIRQILYDSTYISFLKFQTLRNRKWNCGYLGLREKKSIGSHSIAIEFQLCMIKSFYRSVALQLTQLCWELSD